MPGRSVVTTPASVGQGDVLRLQAHRAQQIDAGQRRRAGARGHQPHVADRLALQHQRVAHRGGHGDGGAVLVVVEHRDAHPRPQRRLDLEALRRLDVLEVDGAEGRFQRRHHVDEAGGIGGIHLDIEHVDAGEFLEQDRLAFHHRLGGKRPDIAQAEHRGAVGDHADQVAAHGVDVRGQRVGGDFLAGGGDAGGIGQGEVALAGHALGRLDLELSRPWQAVVIKRGLAEILVHTWSRLPTRGCWRPPCREASGHRGGNQTGRGSGVGAAEKTRTSTGFPPQAPQACASTIPPRPPISVTGRGRGRGRDIDDA